MPNWCDCDLWIKIPRGTKKEIGMERLKHFKLHSNNRYTEEDDLLDANCFIPYPKKFEDMDRKAKAEHEKLDKMTAEEREEYVKQNGQIKDGYNQGGYEWRIKSWGTKWNFTSVGMCEKDNQMVYSFQTAWSPPEPVIKKMAEMYPELKFVLKYYEAGVGYKGELVCEKGKVTKEVCFDNYRGNRGG